MWLGSENTVEKVTGSLCSCAEHEFDFERLHVKKGCWVFEKEVWNQNNRSVSSQKVGQIEILGFSFVSGLSFPVSAHAHWVRKYPKNEKMTLLLKKTVVCLCFPISCCGGMTSMTVPYPLVNWLASVSGKNGHGVYVTWWLRGTTKRVISRNGMSLCLWVTWLWWHQNHRRSCACAERN